MGLDVYVGTLTRYYSGDWETIMQRQGALVVGAPEPAPYSVDELSGIIVAWREHLCKLIYEASEGRENLKFNWSEGSQMPYFTDKPDWGAYASLLLWASYSEHSDLSVPELLDEDWSADDAFSRSTDNDFKSMYTSLLGADLWVPEDFRCVAGLQDAFGNELSIGSAVKLKNELQELNNRTWKADDQIISVWLNNGPCDTGSLENNAQFGYAVFWDLVNKALDNNLIMKTDF